GSSAARTLADPSGSLSPPWPGCALAPVIASGTISAAAAVTAAALRAGHRPTPVRLTTISSLTFLDAGTVPFSRRHLSRHLRLFQLFWASAARATCVKTIGSAVSHTQ